MKKFAIILIIALVFSMYGYAEDIHPLKYYQTLMENNPPSKLSLGGNYENTGIVIGYIDKEIDGYSMFDRIYYIAVDKEDAHTPFAFGDTERAWVQVRYVYYNKVKNGETDIYYFADIGDTVHFTGRFNPYYSSVLVIYFSGESLELVNKAAN